MTAVAQVVTEPYQGSYSLMVLNVITPSSYEGYVARNLASSIDVSQGIISAYVYVPQALITACTTPAFRILIDDGTDMETGLGYPITTAGWHYIEWDFTSNQAATANSASITRAGVWIETSGCTWTGEIYIDNFYICGY